MLEILVFNIFHTESLTLDQIESLALFNKRKSKTQENVKGNVIFNQLNYQSRLGYTNQLRVELSEYSFGRNKWNTPRNVKSNDSEMRYFSSNSNLRNHLWAELRLHFSSLLEINLIICIVIQYK